MCGPLGMPALVPAAARRSLGCFWCDLPRLTSDDTHHYVSSPQKAKEAADAQPPIEGREYMGRDCRVYENRSKKGGDRKIEYEQWPTGVRFGSIEFLPSCSWYLSGMRAEAALEPVHERSLRHGGMKQLKTTTAQAHAEEVAGAAGQVSTPESRPIGAPPQRPAGPAAVVVPPGEHEAARLQGPAALGTGGGGSAIRKTLNGSIG
jgi:hypothetical protein